MPSKIVHMCLDVRGALMNWSDREFRGVFKHDDGRPMSVREAKNALMDEIAKGHEVIPCVNDCEGFDYKTGCPGHPVDEPESISAALPQLENLSAQVNGGLPKC